MRWIELQIKRKKGTAHRSALGAALGVGVSFTPFFGFHLLIIWGLARLLKANVWLGVIASFIGNPWTFPFITLWTFNIGHFILQTDRAQKPLEEAPSLTQLWEKLPYFWEHYIWPMTVGGVPTGILVGILVYFLLLDNIRHYQKLRIQRIRAARQRHKDRELTATEEKAMKVMGRLIERGLAAGYKVTSLVRKKEQQLEKAVKKKLDNK